MKERPIMLVEDNQDDVELTMMAFRRAHISNPVVVAKDGVEALDYLFGRGAEAALAGEQPVVVLLDLNLPKVNGLEVLERIRADERTKRIPVVILTTSNEHGDMIKAGNLHANSYVRKPVDFDTFVEAARQLGLYWAVLNEPMPNSGV